MSLLGEVVKAVVDEIADLIAKPPSAEEEEERAKQIGMSIIRKASDLAAKKEIEGG